jgi:cell division protease FtsH
VEVRKIIDEATAEVRAILQGRRTALEAVARLLVEKEVIDGADLRALIDANDPGPRLVPGSLPATDPAAAAADIVDPTPHDQHTAFGQRR